MENKFYHVMAKRSDEQLQIIAQEKERYEFEAWIAAIEELERRQLATPDLLDKKANALQPPKAEQAIPADQKEEKKTSHRRSWKETLSLFRITKEYFYTPAIIYLNVFVWVLMVLTGVHAFAPSAESLVDWGGNLAMITLNGQPWRLLTSIFLHGGLFHLLLNMYALVQVGALLEIHFGKHRYAFVYIASGILASISSTAFSQNVVSVGASGAIFGLYGLLLSLLITKTLQITPEERSNLLSSTILFIGYNLVFGFAKAGIDNAAHIGGLLSGFIIGFLYYPSVSAPKRSTVISISLSIFVVAAVFAAPYLVTNRYAEFNSVIETFSANENRALWMYAVDSPTPATKEAAKFRLRLKTEGIDLWKENFDLLSALNNMPTSLQQRVDLLKKYCQLRIQSCETMQLLMLNENVEETKHLQNIDKEIEDVINSLRALNE